MHFILYCLFLVFILRFLISFLEKFEVKIMRTKKRLPIGKKNWWKNHLLFKLWVILKIWEQNFCFSNITVRDRFSYTYTNYCHLFICWLKICLQYHMESFLCLSLGCLHKLLMFFLKKHLPLQEDSDFCISFWI